MAANTKVRDSGGVLRTVTAIKMRDAAGTLRTIATVKMRDAANVLRTVYSAMSVALNRETCTGSDGTSTLVTVTTNSAIATPVGGTGPYTYAWSEVESDHHAWTINSPAADTTTFTASNITAGGVAVATFMITVTDANGVVATNTVEAQCSNTNTS